MFSIKLLATLCVLHICHSARLTREVGDKCTTPNSESGECRNIKHCPVLLEVVRETDQLSLLREAACGFQGLDALVCCPELSSRQTPWEYQLTNQPPPLWNTEFTRRTTRSPYDTSRQTPWQYQQTNQPPSLWDTENTRRTTKNTYSTRRTTSISSLWGGESENESDFRPSSSTTRRPTRGSSSGSSNSSSKGQCGKSTQLSADRIVNGDSAALGAWPWVAALGYRSQSRSNIQWLCGGALVSNRHVLTAAHCVAKTGDKTLEVVRLGELDLDDEVTDGASPQDIDIDSTIPHPEYSATAKINDIAIIRLKDAVRFSDYIQPICIPSSSQFGSLVGELPYVVGWGALFFRGPSIKALQQVDVEVTSEENCKIAYQSQRSAVIDNRVICAGKDGKDACQGDSGGPLMLEKNSKYYLIGIVSYGKNCAEPGFPGVYTKVSSFADWINKNLN